MVVKNLGSLNANIIVVVVRFFSDNRPCASTGLM